MKPTDAPNSIFIGILTLHISGSLSAHHQEILAVHFCRFDDRLLPGWNCIHPAPGSKQSSNLQKCTNADIRLRTPDDGQKGCLKHVVS